MQEFFTTNQKDFKKLKKEFHKTRIGTYLFSAVLVLSVVGILFLIAFIFDETISLEFIMTLCIVEILGDGMYYYFLYEFSKYKNPKSK